MATKKIYNDKSDKFADWTTKKLKQEAKGYHELIYGEASCYGKRDLFILDGILNELFSRGIQPKDKLVF